jgi:hypothetical protein
MEAQAHRTAVRVGELERQAVMGPGNGRNDAVDGRDDAGMENVRGSTTYPGTAARRNVTVRRSRDRASDSRTPERPSAVVP